MQNATPQFASTPALPLAQPKFGFGFIPREALVQCAQDTAGVLIPKAPVSAWRNILQFFEDIELELGEDVAFYFTIPVMGNVMAAVISKVHQGLKFSDAGAYKDIGKSWEHSAGIKGVQTLKGVPYTAPTRLIAAKSGVVVGAVASAFAFEYMIQHTKNVITAKKFKTTNFTGVAGLENSRTQIQPGEADPVAKARRRGLQVGGLWLATVLGSALVLPKAITHFAKAETMKIPKILRYFNFGSALAEGEKKAMQFDTTKAFQGLLVMVGLASYLDASRDKLELKEQATRLGVVIPYLLFGQALAKNLLAKGIEQIKVKGPDGVSKSVASLGLKTLNREDGSIWKAMKTRLKTPETFLQADVVKSTGAFAKEVDAKVMAGELTLEAANKIKRLQGKGLFWTSLGLGAAVCGVGINLIAYHQTKVRYGHQEQKKKQLAQPQQPVQVPMGRTVFQSYGGFAAQGKPLEDSPSQAVAAPRVQAPRLGARLSTNPYSYGQWRI